MSMLQSPSRWTCRGVAISTDPSNEDRLLSLEILHNALRPVEEEDSRFNLQAIFT